LKLTNPNPDIEMGALKGTSDKAIGKTKEVVAEIIGDGRLQQEGRQQRRKGHNEQDHNEQDNEQTELNPLAPLNKLT
jgi:uncharacterized protein YjbJ (UPF0337 family)